ncbi:dephospho-CoA kinase [Sulfurivirga caldicuralii]|uniref:Dephospho-CoA kinase n=1 Tax=Sulfurivirga caldicuralii TaxID=364032 RepID=A0A1N6DWJ9_9GAMM|nr:dephospho-CoA kinase [Sulfurivirga caldicuralii]SIN75074.1 dephospho-CoA kinase [Sulfurivirga caldicuralii]
MPTVIALTGGLASGKSTVARYLKEKGYPVFSADEAAREVVAPGEPAWAALRESFGADYFHADGSLDRARLRERVFRDPQARARLEAMTHPAIRTWLQTRIDATDAPVVFVEIPLLVESGRPPFVDQVWVIDCPKALQRARAQARGLDTETIDAILAAQTTRDARKAVADAIISTDSDWKATRQQVDNLLKNLQQTAAP